MLTMETEVGGKRKTKHRMESLEMDVENAQVKNQEWEGMTVEYFSLGK